MKVDQLFSELKLLAEKLGVEVSEQNFRTTGIAVKSGFCKVKDKDLFIIDKHLKKTKKLEILAEYISQFSFDSMTTMTTMTAMTAMLPEVDAYLAPFRIAYQRQADAIEDGLAPKDPEKTA